MGYFTSSKKSTAEAAPAAASAAGKPAASPTKVPPGPGLKLGKTASDDLLKFTAIFKPYSTKDAAGEEARKKGWRMADGNGNGLCSLAECEGFVLKSLVAKFPKEKGKDAKGNAIEPGRDLFDAFRPCYIRAFNDAKDYKADDGAVLSGTKKSTADDFVSRGEFRLFCAYLCIYGAMFDAFAKIDGGGAGRDKNDDRRMELKEWLSGYKGVTDHGFVALASVKSDSAAKDVFKKMDSDGAGMVLLGEFCDYLKAAEIKAKTATGALLAEDEAGGAGGGGGGATGPKQASGPPKGAPNSFGLAVSKKAASKEFFNFMSVFEPLCDEKKGAKAREEGFKAADPNGNGLCSLAELETFVLKSLVTKFPRAGKGKDLQEPGKDLFKAYRPCYIRAFTDAKDYEADSGAKIAGTKKATADDFVSKKEFRLFCVYTIIYAAMFDVFAKIDGGGVGRDANDDKRIEKAEWMAGWKGAQGYGFVAFDSIADKKEAAAAFKKIDDNGGGIVLLDEWCEFIKAGEVAAKTPIGELLNMDEAGGVGTNYKLAGPARVLGKGAPGKAAPKTKAPVAIVTGHNKWAPDKPPPLPSQKRAAPGRPAGAPTKGVAVKPPAAPGLHNNPAWKAEQAAAVKQGSPKPSPKRKPGRGTGTSF